MKRNFALDVNTQIKNRKKLDQIQEEILKSVPECALASDQFSRLMDLAIDFCEDIPPLRKQQVEQIVSIFKTHGAQAKVCEEILRKSLEKLEECKLEKNEQ